MGRLNNWSSGRLFLVGSIGLVVLLNQVSASKKTVQESYDSSYAFLNVRSPATPPQGLHFCLNFQQYRSRALPATVEQAEAYRVGWWNNTYNETDICKQSAHSLTYETDQIVPAFYRTDRRKSSCNRTTDEHFVAEQVSMLEKRNASAILFLVDKGKFNVYGIKDFLFSEFYNPEINESNQHASVFYAYHTLFSQHILPLLDVPLTGQQKAELRIYRPPSWFLDPSVFVMWLLAVGCIAVGCAWMVCETKYGANNLEVSSSSVSQHVCMQEEQLEVDQAAMQQEKSTHPVGVVVEDISAEQTFSLQPTILSGPSTSSAMESAKKKKKQKVSNAEEVSSSEVSWAQMSAASHCVYVMIFVAFVVTILLLSFFFRPYAVLFFNVLLVFLGTIAMHSISYSLLSVFLAEHELFSLSQLCCFSPLNYLINQQKVPLIGWLAKTRLFSQKIRLFSFFLLVACFSICAVWFMNRGHAYSFLLLNFINVSLCIYAVKSTQVRSLRLLTFLLLAMFVYDIFMVFGTRLLTPSGCSVMLQVVTGVDCNNKKGNLSMSDLYPVPPIEVDTPEKIPILFYLPMLSDPMAECFDVEVEKEFRHMMLGLGDVIVPGYLIAFCFYVDMVQRNRYYSFGIVGLVGYSLGMLITALALKLMATAQPALIYLVPFTLTPICLWACYKKSFMKIWRGDLKLEQNS